MNTKKINYSTPQIICVQLDNEIALALQSAPPAGPGEPTGYSPEYFNNDPLRTNLA